MTSHQPKGTTVQGKLPCGNPRRYGGRDVVCMSQGTLRGNKRTASSSLCDDDSTKTEAELHLQHLLEKQMKTDVTLAGHFSEHRSFSEATKHRPGVDELIGVHGYKDYKLASDLDAKIDYLRHCGLNDEEIAIKMRQDMGIKDPSESSGYGPDPESQAHKLEEIERKIEEKEKQLQMPHATKGALLLSRQRLDLEASHKQRFGAKGETSSHSCARIIKGTQIEPEASHPDDPINHIPDILGGLQGKITGERQPRRERRRRRKLEKRMQYYKQFEEEDDNGDEGKANEEADSDADIENASVGSRFSTENGADGDEEDREVETVDLSPSQELQEKPTEATCAPRPFDWVSPKVEKPKKKKPSQPAVVEVEITSGIEILTREYIAANKMSVNEIRQLPRFENYTPGQPNRVLYLKNVAIGATSRDLMELFGCLQQEGKPRISLRLLSGRMRGQAFVTLPDEAVASEALNLVNGYLLHGSPVIVSFGKKT